MIDLDPKYLAGFFDGEGCVYIQKNKKGFWLTVGITQRDQYFLEKLRNNFGGSIQRTIDRKRNLIHYTWFLQCKQAYFFLSQIYPFVNLKKVQIKLALEFQESLFSRRKGLLTPEEIRYRNTCKERLSLLKRG